MRDVFKQIIRQEWYTDDPDLRGIGHTTQRNKYLKKQKRRARRVLKQNLKKELKF